MKKVIKFLVILLFLAPCVTRAEINNTLAYSVSHTSSTGVNDLNTIANKTVAQTILATADETWYGIVVYLDRMGLSTNTDSVKLRLGGNTGFESCDPPDTNLVSTIVYVKVSDIPDGDVVGNTLPPDSIGRGYQIWFIFSSPMDVLVGNCYSIFLNAPKVDASNRICWNSGSNGYASGTAWYQTTGAWTSYGYDLNFRVIKDKYALVAMRRLPFNTKGVLTIASDIDGSSVDYNDSLQKWLCTPDNIGGSWGQGLNGKIAGSLWFGRSSTADSLGTYNKEVPFYFHGLDTTSNFYKDTVDNYVSRRWFDSQHSYVDCDWDGSNPTCVDSTYVKKFLYYMLNRPTAFGKIYKSGFWINHASQYINFGNAGETTRLGDSTGTVYYHANYTLATGRHKFIHIGALVDPLTSSSQTLPWTNWQTLQDSLNFNCLPFNKMTLRDNTKTYVFARVGRSAAAVPDSIYKFFNLNVARRCVDSNFISVVYSHLGKTGGLDQDDRDSIKAVHDSASTWKLWIPSTKTLFNQQAASAFAQITVDRPSGSKRRINIRSLYDWSWGSRVPDREEVYYLTFIAYAPESLIVTINASDTLTDSVMTNQQDVATDYITEGLTGRRNRQMSWVGMYNRTAGRKIIVYPTEAPPTGEGKSRIRRIEQLLSRQDREEKKK